MVRRIALALLATALGASTLHAGLPRRAGLSYAITGRFEKALDTIPADTKDNAERYFRAIALIETGRTREGFDELAKLGSSTGAFAWAASEKTVEYAFSLERHKYLVETVAVPAGAKYIDPDGFNYRYGASLFLVGREAEAVGFLNRVEDNRFRHFAQYTLAQISYQSGDYPDAMEHLAQALDAVRHEPDRILKEALTDQIRLTRGRVVFQAAKGDPDMTAENREKLLKLGISQLTLIKPESGFYAEALRTIGWCSVLMNDTVRGLAAFQTAMGADPDNAHEDVWATGRMLERIGFFEEAAAAYAQAGSLAREHSAALKNRNLDWSRLLSRIAPPEDARIESKIAGLEVALTGVEEEAQLSRGAAGAKSARLDAFDANLQTVLASLTGIDQELEVMTGDLSRYIDAMPSYALFPKKDRARILLTLDSKERLKAEVAEVRVAVNALSETRAYERAGPERKAEVEKLWKRLDKAEGSLEESELALLEAMKKRVSVREKELAGLLGDKKAENNELRGPITASQKMLQEERKKLNELSTRLLALEKRLAGARARVGGLRTDYAKVRAQYDVVTLARLSLEAGKRADQFNLDEAQALHLLKTRQESEDQR